MKLNYWKIPFRRKGIIDMGDLVQRDERGHFLPGVSGNPSGRTPRITNLVKAKTADGELMVDFLVRVLNGEEQEINGKPATLKNRIESAVQLLAYGYGKPSSIDKFEISRNPEAETITVQIIKDDGETW